MYTLLLIPMIAFTLISCKKDSDKRKVNNIENSSNSLQNIKKNVYSSTDTVLSLKKTPTIDKDKNTVFRELENTINLKDYGVYGNGTDETKKIQAALIDAVGKTLYIPKQLGDFYFIRQLIIPSNIKIVCEKGVVFMGSDDLKQTIKDFEVMFRFENSENVIFDGNGATFQMNKSNYSGEHNHIFMINGGKNISLKNINTENSGGDGFYIGAYKTKENYSSNIKIENCKANNSRRQGLSVISVNKLRVNNSEFNGSNGADPQSGIDIEPNNSKAILKDILITNTKANDNKKRGFIIDLQKLNASSDPIDITFKNCVANNNMEGFSNRMFVGVQGTVNIENCIANNSKLSGFTEVNCLASSVRKNYSNCLAKDSHTYYKKANNYKYRSGFYILGTESKSGVIGNSHFIKCQSINSNGKDNDYGIVIDNGEIEFKNIKLTNFKTSNNKKGEVYYKREFNKNLKIENKL